VHWSSARRFVIASVVVLATTDACTGPARSPSAQPAARLAIDLAGSWKYSRTTVKGHGRHGDRRRQLAVDEPASNWFLLGRKEYPSEPARPRRRSGRMSRASSGRSIPTPGSTTRARSGSPVDRDPAGREGPFVLDLDMVDYYAEVFVNGVPVGHHEGTSSAVGRRDGRPARRHQRDRGKGLAPRSISTWRSSTRSAGRRCRTRSKASSPTTTPPGGRAGVGRSDPPGDPPRVALRESRGRSHRRDGDPLDVSETSARS